MAEWFHEGERLTQLPIDDRSVQYGDGLFESIAIRAGRPRLWEYHMQRLALACDRLGLELPRADRLLRDAMDALQRSEINQDYCLVKILLSAGIGERGYGRHTPLRPSVLLGVYPAESQARIRYREGVDTSICETRLAIHSPTAGLKTLNRLEQVLARSEFAGSDYFDGLTMDAEDNIICGTMSNVFFGLDDVLYTPPLDRCGVAGVMRSWLIDNLPQNGIDVRQRCLPRNELPYVGEMFLANSQFSVLPVRRCGEREWPVGDITKSVMVLLRNNGVVEGL